MGRKNFRIIVIFLSENLIRLFYRNQTTSFRPEPTANAKSVDTNNFHL